MKFTRGSHNGGMKEVRSLTKGINEETRASMLHVQMRQQ